MGWKEKLKSGLGMSAFPLACKSKRLMIEGQIDYGSLNEFMGYYGHDVLAGFGLY